MKSSDKIEMHVIFLLAGHKVHFIPPVGKTNSFSEPCSRKKSFATRNSILRA